MTVRFITHILSDASRKAGQERTPPTGLVPVEADAGWWRCTAGYSNVREPFYWIGAPTGSRTPLPRMKTWCPNR